MARLLVEKGVDVGAKDRYGRIALHWVVGRGREAVKRFLERYEYPLY